MWESFKQRINILWKQTLYILKHKERLCLINTLDSSESETYSDFPDRAKSTSLAHYVVFGGFPQKASEGDDGGHAGTIEEEDGGQALQAKRVPHIAPVKWSFPLNVLHQSTKYPVMKEEKKEKS